MKAKPHFSLLATSFAGGPRPRNTAVILFGLWFLLFFAALFSPSVLDDADATHASAARAMATTGDLVTLHVDGVRYLEKAPLPYWLAALSFRLFGFNTFAAHLPQALAVLLLMLLGFRWANQAFGSRTGFYTALAVLTSAGVFLFTRILIPEVMLSLLLGASLFAFLKSLGPIAAETAEPSSVSLGLQRDSAHLGGSPGLHREQAHPGGSPGLHYDPAHLGGSPGLHREQEHFGGSLGLQSKQAHFGGSLGRDRDHAPLGGSLGLQPQEYTPPNKRGFSPGPFARSTTPPESPAAVFDAGPLFYPYVMWSTLALAVLAKGLVALVLFFTSTILFLILTDELRNWRRLRPFTGLLLFLAIAAPWHILAGLRNPGGGMNGHGFFWFYFVNEHFLRFLGRRTPADYNKLPGYLYWSLHLVWLFPWALFLPLGVAALWRRFRHQTFTITHNSNLLPPLPFLLGFMLLGGALALAGADVLSTALCVFSAYILFLVAEHRHFAGFTRSPFHRIDPQQRTILLLSLFSAIVLIFFSLSTNQEYYTFPAYLPLLLLIAATITRAEQTFASDPGMQRTMTAIHAAFTVIGAAIALTLFYGLWASRKLPYLPDIGLVLAHRGIGDYTLSLSHLFDLTTQSFAALRLPALLAAVAVAFGPTLAWLLRIQRRHLASTTAIALTSAAFLFAAHIAFARFGPMLSSENLAAKIHQLEMERSIAPETQIALFGDQSFGSSIPFYLGRPVLLVDARSSSMLFGSTFPDVPPVFLTIAQLLAQWGSGPRKILFVPLEKRAEVDRLLGTKQIVLEETSGKLLITDRPLEARPLEARPAEARP